VEVREESRRGGAVPHLRHALLAEAPVLRLGAPDAHDRAGAAGGQGGVKGVRLLVRAQTYGVCV